MEIQFEKLDVKHQQEVLAIFNSYIESGTTAFPPAAVPESFFAFLLERTKGYPAYALVNGEDGRVAGFCFLSAYHPLPTFK